MARPIIGPILGSSCACDEAVTPGPPPDPPTPSTKRYAVGIPEDQNLPVQADFDRAVSSDTGMIDFPPTAFRFRKCFMIASNLASLTTLMQTAGFANERNSFVPDVGDPDVLLTFDGMELKVYVERASGRALRHSQPYTLE